jgi:amino acid adenylation domain-containing protein
VKASALLLDLLRKGAQVWAEGDELCLRAAKGTLTPALREELSRRKPEVVTLLGQGTRHALCSFSQQRLWLLDQLEPGTSTYNTHKAIRLSGALDAGALQRSLGEIVSRHEALRTTFTAVDGEPVQVIAPSMDVELSTEDLSGLPQAEREARATRSAGEEARRPFDLERGPLVRARLLRLGEEEHLLLYTMHHIVTDGWSTGVFWRELGALYEAFSSGEPSPLVEPAIQYADFAVWQRGWLTGEVLEEQLGYWRHQLSDLPALELPTDRPRPAAVQAHRGARQRLELPEGSTRALKELARMEGATLFMVLLAAFQVLLSRYSGQEDIAVGTPIAGRNRPGDEGLIGRFVNTLVMRTDLSGDPTFRELLGRVREAALGAYDHQDLPFERLVEELQVHRDLSRVPLSPVMLALQNVPRESLQLPGLNLEQQEVEGGTVKYDLFFSMSEEKGLKGGLAYNADLFDEAMIGRMVGHFRTLLEGIVAAPDRHLSELPLLTEEELHQLLEEWNGTETPYSQDRCIQELFEEQVERTPDAVAVVFEEQQLTYRELNRRANQLAHHLRALGVGPGVLVGICAERSVEVVVGLLGILKTGGAYVPLDPAYPKERLSFMLEDARAPVLLTQERLVGGLPEHVATVVRLDADWPVIAQEAEENPTSGTAADDLAYVIYTSGSTGRPKGVMIEHRALSSYVAAAIAAYEITASDRVLQLASLSYDGSVEEVFPCLTSGATLVLRSDRMIDSMQRFGRECGERAISVLFMPTAFWHELVSAFEREKLTLPPSVRLVSFGGQKALAQRVAQWHEGQTATPARLFNTYGPTEATVVATLCELRPEAGQGNAKREVPIGRPLGDTRVYILDGNLNPAPIGVPGELHIGGSCLARGYLNRPELTSERFIPDPFSDAPEARLYKTGDTARWRSDGNIEYVGRIDDQVKIRGFRVEPAEVEATLEEHAALQGVAVVVRNDSSGDERLVAYMVPHRHPAPTVGELRGYLKERLPEYMVPSAFVTLEALPLTPNGKIDRRALQAPDPAGLRAENAYAEPRTRAEEVLAGIWEEVLGLGRVGIHDDFFELGGHSLLATRVVSRVGDALRVELPLRYLFETPTVAGLAERIEAIQGSAPSVGTLSSYSLSQGRL